MQFSFIKRLNCESGGNENPVGEGNSIGGFSNAAGRDDSYVFFIRDAIFVQFITVNFEYSDAVLSRFLGDEMLCE